MFHLSSTSRQLGWLVFLVLLGTPALAHNVEVSKDVAATFHLEPNHNPKAGEPAQVWFALTRKGGQLIPLTQCNCKLAVYSQPYSIGAPPLLEPSLKAISVERYQGIPGTKIVFPKAGVYELKLSGTPKAGVSFKPFQLDFDVTVAAGTSAPIASPKPSGSLSRPSNQLQVPTLALATILGLGILGFLWRRLN